MPETVNMKPILLTFTTTIAALTFASTFFLNTLLGTFGLAATSIDTLNTLKSSQMVVDKMKTRHHIKKQALTKNLAKRSSRRVASASLAAATIGTVAVAVTMTGFEIHDYCEDKASLQNEQNILFGTSNTFDFESCIEEGKIESKRILLDVKAAASEHVNNAIESTAQYSHEKWNALKESNNNTFSSVDKATNELSDSLKKELIP
jgi:hypothetical protein